MILLIHDLQNEDAVQLVSSYPQATVVVTDDGSIRPCIGCFGCWIKTPGQCVLVDKYSNMGGLIASCSELHLVSSCVYGGYSHFVKNILDRSISFIHPYFVIRQGETHHRLRYEQSPDLRVCFYGKDISEVEKETARNLVKANALNLGCSNHSVSFVNGFTEMKERGVQDASCANQR